MTEWKPGEHQLFELRTRLGSFQLHDQAVAQQPRQWGCHPAEYYVDAMAGTRARYDALADASSIRVRVAFDAEELELPEFTEDAHKCYVCPSPEGRWITAPSGQLLLSGGMGEPIEIPLPAGDYRLLWFVRIDVCPFLEPQRIPHHLSADPNLAQQIIVLRPLAADEPLPFEELAPEQQVYADWYRIQQIDDPQRLAMELDEPDEQGCRRLVILYRLGSLGTEEARGVLEQVRLGTGQTILAIIAREILNGHSKISGPQTLEGLPVP